jgi:7,8-dihydroneopterin 2',3'-cyclic phosphate phosphodiesterase
MKKLIEFAEMIKNKELRKKVIEILEKPEVSNPEIIHPREKLERIPAWVGGHHAKEGGLLEHTISVTKLAIEIAKHFEKMYNVSINYDYLIAGALLHDLMKIYILTKQGGNWGFTGCLLDHAVFTACELYARGFPEEVIHIVASHGGELGSAGANPKTIEAFIVFYADILDSTIESSIRGVQQLQLILLPKESESE